MFDFALQAVRLFCIVLTLIQLFEKQTIINYRVDFVVSQKCYTSSWHLAFHDGGLIFLNSGYLYKSVYCLLVLALGQKICFLTSMRL